VFNYYIWPITPLPYKKKSYCKNIYLYLSYLVMQEDAFQKLLLAGTK
jgi:hypothetical protein